MQELGSVGKLGRARRVGGMRVVVFRCRDTNHENSVTLFELVRTPWISHIQVVRFLFLPLNLTNKLSMSTEYLKSHVPPHSNPVLTRFLRIRLQPILSQIVHQSLPM
jgi:hypothetical protein